MKYIILSLATIVSAVLAAPAELFFDIQQPGQNSVFHYGESVPLSWNHGTSSKAVVTVLKGETPEEMIPTNYRFEIPGGSKSKSTSWKVPSTLSTTEKYNFEITYIGDSDQQEGKSYSNMFSVVDNAPQEQNAPTTMTTTANGDNGGSEKKKNNDGQTAAMGSLVQGNPIVAQGNPMVAQGNQAVQNGARAVAIQGKNAVPNGGTGGYPAQNKIPMISNTGGPVQDQNSGRQVKGI